MKHLIAITLMVLASHGFASANQLAAAKEAGCITTFEALAEEAIAANSDLIFAWQLKTGIPINSLDSFVVCDIQDLTPGSFGLLRELSLCLQDGVVLQMISAGNLYCSSEKSLGISGLSQD